MTSRPPSRACEWQRLVPCAEPCVGHSLSYRHRHTQKHTQKHTQTHRHTDRHTHTRSSVFFVCSFFPHAGQPVLCPVTVRLCVLCVLLSASQCSDHTCAAPRHATRECEEAYVVYPRRTTFFRNVHPPPNVEPRKFQMMLAQGGIHPRGVVLTNEFFQLPLALVVSLLQEEVAALHCLKLENGIVLPRKTRNRGSSRNTFVSPRVCRRILRVLSWRWKTDDNADRI